MRAVGRTAAVGWVQMARGCGAPPARTPGSKPRGSLLFPDHPCLEPRHFVDEKAVNESHKDYMFLECVLFITEVSRRAEGGARGSLRAKRG